MKLKSFKFPTFEEWEKKECKVRLELGAYCVEVRAFSWGRDGTTYMFAASLADRNPLNIYTPQIFSRRFEYVGDDGAFKEWYNNTVSEFNQFFENLLRKTYIEEE